MASWRWSAPESELGVESTTKRGLSSDEIDAVVATTLSSRDRGAVIGAARTAS